jgi:hypothetical protein
MANSSGPSGHRRRDDEVALYSVSVTSTGKVIIPARSNSTSSNGFLLLSASVPDPCGTNNSCNLTVTGSLGSSVTVTLPPATY